MTQIHFTHWEGNHPRLQCVWNDELRFFPDEDHARAWASRQGLRAVFQEEVLHPPLYMYGVTGLEDE